MTTTLEQTQKQIDRLTQQYIKEATPLFLQQAVAQATETIENGVFAAARNGGLKVSNGNGAKTRTAKPAKAKAKTGKKGKRGKTGKKRSPEALFDMQVKIFTTVQKAGKKGATSAAIQEATGFDPKALGVPLKKLLTTKKLRKTGERNQTVYFARKNATVPTAEA
jgi:hypothetical protein